MSGWDAHGAGSDSGSGPEHEPSEERGRAAWADGGTGATPPWASAETQVGNTLPPWAVAQTQTGGTVPPPTPTPSAAPYATPPAPSATPPYTSPPAPSTAPPCTLTPAPRPPAPWHGAGRTAALFVLTVVLGAGVGAGVWYLARDHSGGTGAAPAASVSVTAPAPSAASSASSASAPPTASQSATAVATPSGSTLGSSSAAPGYRTAQDPIGYTIDVPRGWTRRQQQGEKAPVVYYDSPGDGRQLQIFALSEATPAESLDLAENDPGYGFAEQPGYQVQDRTSGDTWSEVSYRYDDKDKGARLVIDHRFQAADGTLYAIRASGPEDLDQALVREPLSTAVASFCPSGTQCG